MNTPNNEIPFVPENTLDPAAGLNQAIDKVDGLLQLSVIDFLDAPPASPSDGDRYIVTVGVGAWLGQDDKVARYIADGDSWQFYDAYSAVCQNDEAIYGKFSGVWKVLATAL